MTLPRTAVGGVLFLLLTGLALRQHDVAAAPRPARPSATAAKAETGYAQRRLTFERNQGQTDDSVRYIARARGYTIFLTDADAIIRVADARRDIVRMTLAGGAAHPRIVPAARAAETTNYLLGNDSQSSARRYRTRRRSRQLLLTTEAVISLTPEERKNVTTARGVMSGVL
jgi:hypothetical protein